ncbi:hypothetical protein F511_32389 [Dorcoceras hygrometricum]|uniref:Uncharacterized protein n=1 Tax=Dorcoceras hygrometricum TaxID=472368 RepID=A0A2Z7C6H1_9LAMI|nr:hypothetical protein F511_32389 [Dorcoceras hygrometricum]
MVWTAAYFSKLFSFPTSSGSLSITLLMQGQLGLSAVDFIDFLQTKSFDDLTPAPKPHVGSFDQLWIAAHPRFKDETRESVFDILLTACIHHRFLIVDCIGARPSVVAKAKVGWSFEVYNPALVARQFGFLQVIPHTAFYYPLYITHLASEIELGRFSRATVELLSFVPSLFLNPARAPSLEDECSFQLWWALKFASLVPTFCYPPAKGKKSVASAGNSVEPSSIEVKSKKRKVLSAPPRPIQRSSGRLYSTRSSSRLVSKFSNTDDDPVDLVSSPIAIGDGDDDNDGDDAITPPDPLLFMRMCLWVITPSRSKMLLVRCIPSMESISFAKAAVHNFLELDLHQLGESQRLAMISAISILRASPEFISEYPLLDSVAIIFSDSDAAQTLSNSSLSKLEDFRSKRRRVEEMEQEGLHVRAQIKERTDLRASEEKQGECLLKWEQLRRLFS